MRRDIVIRDLSEATYQRLIKRKERDGFDNKDWRDWISHLVVDVNLVDSPSETIQATTRESLLETWIQNLSKNLPKIWTGESINTLVPEECAKAEKEGKNPDFPTGTSVVIGRGPSVFKKKHLETLASSGYKGTVVCTDGALIEALKAGVRPDQFENFLSVSVDGNRELIRKWYDHELVDKYGPYIKVVVTSSVAPNVVERAEKAGAKVYFFLPLYDDWRQIESFTKMHQYMTMSEKHPHGIPAMNASGHAGGAAWTLAWLVMRKSPVTLIGIDLGYLPEDPLESTYYWKGLMQRTQGNVAMVRGAYETIHNPDFDTDAVIDPVFKHYRESFREMVAISPEWVETINCTEGGSLFGEGIKPMKFSEFLERYPR